MNRNPVAIHRAAAALALALAPCPPARAVDFDVPGVALTIHGGRMASNDWEDFALQPQSLDFVDTWLLGAGLARQLAQAEDRSWAVEVEGQLVKSFGGQRNWEANLPVVLRWQKFPWQARVETTAAFGIGLSYASEVPRTEVEIEGASRRLMVHWHIELTTAPPRQPWAAVVRLHHRSTAYGLFGSRGGSNALTAGLKWRF